MRNKVLSLVRGPIDFVTKKIQTNTMNITQNDLFMRLRPKISASLRLKTVLQKLQIFANLFQNYTLFSIYYQFCHKYDVCFPIRIILLIL